MNGRYELRKGKGDWSNRHCGLWEVAHFWDDGVTVQVRYFRTRMDAQKYIDEKTGAFDLCLDENGFPMI
jgi:hypothetical protein